ncbi:MAG TPA: peptide ABC transporter substrate-binding protein [Thiotrichales bacterium]|nr:peptide ABC transporter substrate-binding protein [Thiotrichales bacterium]
MQRIVRIGLVLLLAVCTAGCTDRPWNNPYPASQDGKNILYSSFSERPKHLDPARSYSSNEWTFIEQIYEAPLQYHYLKRPYTLIPRTAVRMPEVWYEDAEGNRFTERPPEGRGIVATVYEIRIRPGILYAPHPAFARDGDGRYRYHDLHEEDLEDVHTLADFPETGTRELTAADYVYQIKRLAHPRLLSPVFGLMRQYIDGMDGLAERLKQDYDAQRRRGIPPDAVWLDLRGYDFPGAQVVDRYTYRIRIRGEYPQFRYWLAMPFFSPMPWEADRFFSQPGMADRNLTLDWYPVGTGPYMLTENNPNLRMRMDRNPNFRGEPYPSEGAPGDAEAGLLADAGRRMPFIDSIIFNLEKEDIPYWNKFLQGYYDTSGITSDSFDQAVRIGSQGEVNLSPEMASRGIRLSTAVAPSVYYFGFNMLDPVVGGYDERARKLRLAISIAIDYEEFISIFTNDRGVPAQGPLPPGIFGYREGKAGINPYVYDWTPQGPRRKPLSVARRLLAEAGYPDGRDARTGRPLTLYLDTTGSGPDAKARLDWFRKQFEKLNIQLVIRNTDYNRFQEKMSNGTAQMFQWGWNADYPDPENFLFLLYGPNGKVKHHGENAANYENAEYDRLFVRMKNLPDGPERLAVIDRMLDIVRRDAPWAWGYYPKQFSLYHQWYHNVKPNLIARNTLKYRRIDASLRDRLRREWNRPVLWPLGVLAILLVLAVLPAWIGYRRHELATAREEAD